jgi:predicted signal transduction protein with EAL and GGDEF domain
MSAALIDLLPDLVFLMRRDGTIVAHMGGKAVPDLCGHGDETDNRLEHAWSPATATLIKRLLRRSIAGRTPVEARFHEHGRNYDIRVTPQGPNRAIGVVRAALSDAPADTEQSPNEPRWLGLDRRGFLRRLNDSLAMAVLRERPLSVAVFYIEGVAHISRTMGARVSDEVMSRAMAKASAQLEIKGDAYLGQLRENVAAAVINSVDRETIEARITAIRRELKAPVQVGDVTFKLTPYVGVGQSGADAPTAEALLEHARTAMAEARRSLSEQVFFYSDALHLRSLSRLDLGRELRDAIANRDIGFRYVGRHDLITGRQVASVAYLRWRHPLRGEIAPAEFLRIAVATGLAVDLSRMALERIVGDALVQSQGIWPPDLRVSFGPLRDHIFHEGFVADVERVLARNVLPPERFELRIAEKAFVARDTRGLRALQKRGVQLVVDEMGRGMASLVSLATAPIWGLQLDRGWVSALRYDENDPRHATARKVCRATMSIANALGIAPVAAGVDDQSQRDALVAMGCRYGSGDFFRGHDNGSGVFFRGHDNSQG